MTYSDFKVGQIYRMAVASRSHVKRPYYVEVIDVGIDYVTLNIPVSGFHSLVVDEMNCSYHFPRMTYIGQKSDFEHLLINQDSKDLLLTSDKWREKQLDKIL